MPANTTLPPTLRTSIFFPASTPHPYSHRTSLEGCPYQSPEGRPVRGSFTRLSNILTPWEKERGGGRDRETNVATETEAKAQRSKLLRQERERQTDRETDRQTDREDRDRQTDRPGQRNRKRTRTGMRKP